MKELKLNLTIAMTLEVPNNIDVSDIEDYIFITTGFLNKFDEDNEIYILDDYILEINED